MCSWCWIEGSAVLTIVTSSRIIPCDRHMAKRVSLRFRVGVIDARSDVLARVQRGAFAHPQGQTGSGRYDRLEVLDHRERVVEVVQQAPPLFVGRRAPEAFGVSLEGLPL